MSVYNTKILAHRGASAYAPENSMEAFKLAYDMGADGIEFDVHFSKDNEIVIAHDEAIDRVSNGKGLLKDYTLSELRNFDFNCNMDKFKDVKIPTLSDVLLEFSGKNFMLNIEIKNNIFAYEGIEAAILDLLYKHNALDNVLFSSFNHSAVVTAKTLNPKAACAFLFADGIINISDYLNTHGISHANLADYLCTKDELSSLNKSNIAANVWTVNERSELEKFMKMGVNSVITNRPDLALEIKNGK